jgi:DNA (cytosine-5)-methyltransferase 1
MWGGSTMGYEFAGYNHLGGVEIDPKIAEIYKQNHSPKYLYNCDIRELLNKELPEELYNLDILDGSPPCTSFSMAGKREKDWGKQKKFSEGQAYQSLDDLFFTFIELAKKLKPKIIVAENVSGILAGNAKVYVAEIITELQKANYHVQIFKLNAASMGVPQRRERVFFIARQNSLELSPLKLSFDLPVVTYNDIKDNNNINKAILFKKARSLLLKASPGNYLRKYHPKRSYFSYIKINYDAPLNTLTSNSYRELINMNGFGLSEREMLLASSFPLDYIYPNKNRLKGNPILSFLTGMSVPPLMIANISDEIYHQLIKNLDDKSS